MAKKAIVVFVLPLFVFFVLNALTPVWWDDFIMACRFDVWYETHSTLAASFSDVWNSTVNMYCTWHGRSVVDFLNFLFMSIQAKTVFNICNTAVYGLFVFLMCFHITGTFRPLFSWLFVTLHPLLWMLIPAWGQNLLWLTGSINYLWTGTLILLFLIPFRRRMDDSAYAMSVPLSILWLFAGIVAGWTMENSASGVFALLACYFVWNKFVRRNSVRLFEALGAAGFLSGFFMLVTARPHLFRGFYTLLLNFMQVNERLMKSSGLLVLCIFALSFYILRVLKQSLPRPALFFFSAAVGAAYSMILSDHFPARSWFMPQVFFLLSLLCLLFPVRGRIPKKSAIALFALLWAAFVPWFLLGAKSIAVGYLFTEAREEYVLEQRNLGVRNIAVKTPVPAVYAQSGLWNGKDVLPLPRTPHEDSEFVAHNSAWAAWYGLKSVRGISGDAPEEGRAVRDVWNWIAQSESRPSRRALLQRIYDDW
ncbi:MAG: DUF6056 family protein [Fibrobacteraceae bacterium]